VIWPLLLWPAIVHASVRFHHVFYAALWPSGGRLQPRYVLALLLNDSFVFCWYVGSYIINFEIVRMMIYIIPLTFECLIMWPLCYLLSRLSLECWNIHTSNLCIHIIMFFPLSHISYTYMFLLQFIFRQGRWKSLSPEPLSKWWPIGRTIPAENQIPVSVLTGINFLCSAPIVGTPVSFSQ
jgi:hypothetical protein